MAAGLARSCHSGVPEEPEREAPHRSIPWQQRHPRHDPSPLSPPPSSRPPEPPPGPARGSGRRRRTTAMFKIKLEPLKMTAWTLNVFVKFR